jgi:hypothetical protein
MAPVESAESDGRRVALSKCSPVCADQTLCPFKFGKSFPAFQSVVTIQSLIAFKHQQSPGVSVCKIVPVLSPDVSLICLDSNSCQQMSLDVSGSLVNGSVRMCLDFNVNGCVPMCPDVSVDRQIHANQGISQLAACQRQF